MADATAGSLDRRLVALSVLGIATVCLTFAAIRSHDRSDNLFIAIVTVQACLAIAAMRLATTLAATPTLVVLFGVGLILRVVLFATPPLLSDDIYRYIWDGRILNAGFNPFLHVPADPVLASLRDGSIWPHVDKKDYAVTIYPPVAQAIFGLVTRIADSLYSMKLAMLAFETLGVAAMVSLLRQMGDGMAPLALYYWHPFSAWEVANNGHVDAAMMGAAVAGLAWCTYRRPVRLALTLASAALIKPFAVLFLPSTWRPFDVRLPLLVLLFAGVCYAPFLASAGSGVLGFLGQYFQEQGLASGSGFFFVLMAFKLGAPPIARDIYLVASAMGLLALAIGLALRARRDDRARLVEAALLGITFLIVLTPVYPWYFLLVAPFAVLLRSRCAFAMMTTGFWLYSFAPDQIDFIYRWAASLALILLAAGFDVMRLRRGQTAEVLS